MCLDLTKSIKWLRPRLKRKTILPINMYNIWATVLGLFAFNSRILLLAHIRISHLSGDFRWGCCSGSATLEYLHPRTWPVCTAVCPSFNQSEKTSSEQVSGWEKKSTSQHGSRLSFQSENTSPGTSDLGEKNSTSHTAVACYSNQSEKTSPCWNRWVGEKYRASQHRQSPIIPVSLKKHHCAGTGEWVEKYRASQHSSCPVSPVSLKKHHQNRWVGEKYSTSQPSSHPSFQSDWKKHHQNRWVGIMMFSHKYIHIRLGTNFRWDNKVALDLMNTASAFYLC